MYGITECEKVRGSRFLVQRHKKHENQMKGFKVIFLARFTSGSQNICWIAKFDEDISNHGRLWTITIWRTSARRFWFWTFDLYLSKINNVVLNICAKFHENRSCSFREITTNVMNKRTNQPTNKLAWSQYLLAEVKSNNDAARGEYGKY